VCPAETCQWAVRHRGDTGPWPGHNCRPGDRFSTAQGSGPGGLDVGPHGGPPDTPGRRTLLYTGTGAAVAGSVQADQRAVPARDAVATGRLRGNGGGAGAWTDDGAGGSRTGGAGELAGGAGATIKVNGRDLASVDVAAPNAM
jgi:hypothetical protein